MEANPFRDVELIAHVKQIAEIHGISLKSAITYYIKQLEVQLAENEEKIANYKSPPSKLMLRLGEEKYNMLIEKLVKKVTSSSELSQAYYSAKASGRLKQAKLKIEGEFHIINSEFIGNKFLEVGTILEAEVYDEQLYQVWISTTEREFVFNEELEIL
ncbi:hypothetical protein H6G81_05705 [Scytonema hofmannii FACHB-248]|uniref:Uncharacterized protein n=1 Tax=Scytonema hofmannii FACHB-248 TaxID=1842502 RepID=A0ABR8GKY1_9CYAN|nr:MULTISPECIES: hypothetical protein [Nostocales]MBD2604035.1 hypothetical protein [Scytonema hofmannii FACHB-248]